MAVTAPPHPAAGGPGPHRAAQAPRGFAWLRRNWPRIRLPLLQITTSATLATLIGALIFQHRFPFFAPLLAITTVQVLGAAHHRGLWLFLFGEVNGMVVGTLFNPSWSTSAAALDALVGVVVATMVTVMTSPRTPVKLINDAIHPVLTRLSAGIRATASALRANDSDAAQTAVNALNEIEADLHRLDEVLHQVRRSSLLTQWRTGMDLDTYTRTARDIGQAVRDVRSLARHAWWGVLRQGEPVPQALPQMLDTLADGVAVLRDELQAGGKADESGPLLVSAARWIDVMRSQPLSISAAAIAASADAAVLDLLTSIGMTPTEADRLLHQPLVEFAH